MIDKISFTVYLRHTMSTYMKGGASFPRGNSKFDSLYIDENSKFSLWDFLHKETISTTIPKENK